MGVDTMALHPDDPKLYVSEQSLLGTHTPAVNVYNAATGAFLHPLSDDASPGVPSAAVLLPTGICFAKPSTLQLDIDVFPQDDVSCINNTGHGIIPVAILGRPLRP